MQRESARGRNKKSRAALLTRPGVVSVRRLQRSATARMSGMVGGFSATEVDDTIRDLVANHKAKIEEAAGEEYQTLEPVEAAKQVVCGCGAACWRIGMAQPS